LQCVGLQAKAQWSGRGARERKGGGDECKIEEFQAGKKEKRGRKGEVGSSTYIEATSGEVTKQRIGARNLKRQN
jgi:hypothetical protein